MNKKATANCKVCSAPFSFYRRTDRKGNGSYCSVSCKNKARLRAVALKCCTCGKGFMPWQPGIGKYCSMLCVKNRPPESVPNWNGGIWVSNRTGHVFGSIGAGRARGMHRLTAEKAIGRKLLKTEVVLPVNGDKADYAIGNLYICESQSEAGKILMGSQTWPALSNLNTYYLRE